MNNEKKKANISLYFIYTIAITLVIFIIFLIYNNQYVFYIKDNEIYVSNEENYTVQIISKYSKYSDSNNYTFKSSNEKIVKIDEYGKITPIGVGKAEIIIKSKKGFHKEKITIIVQTDNDKEIENIWFSSNVYALKINNTLTLSLITDSTINKIENITWESSDKNVATVDSKGNVKALKNGETTITATIDNGLIAKCKIIVQSEEVLSTSITLNKENIILHPNEKETLVATILPENSTNKNIAWASSNNNIAEVKDGVITAKNIGVTTITATLSNGISSSCIVDVQEIVATSISLSRTNVTLNIGGSETLTVDITPDNVTNKNITWKSSDESIVTVKNGKITAKKEGITTITATLQNGLSKECIVTVTKEKINPTSITLNKNTVDLSVGKSETLTANILPTNATNRTITWKSNNNAIATVENGKITAKSVGTTTITATLSNGLKAECKVTVKMQEIAAQGVTLDKTNAAITATKTLQLTATISPVNATNKNITWTTSDSNIATVENGKVTAKKEGTVTITAQTANGKVATCKITVQTPTTEEEMCEYIKINNLGKVTYSYFQKVIQNKDDYYAIKAAHDCANKLNLPVYAKQNGVYNIYKEKSGEGSIVVRTSTNLNNSTIYIHDETGIIGTTKDRNAIYSISNSEKNITFDSNKISTLKSQIKKGVKNINVLSGYGDILVQVTNDNKKHFIRYGSNANSGDSQTEVFKVDNNGNVLNDVIWNYDDITAVKIIKIPTTTLDFKNGNFVTIANTSSNIDSNTNYAFRGISVKRSKTTLTNINHTVVNSNKSKITTIDYTYFGFIEIAYTSDVTMSHCNLYALKTTNTTPNSTYDLIINNSTNLIMYYVNIPDNQLTDKYWGVIATNKINDIKFNQCKLNRIDSHTGVYNLTITNSTIGDRGLSLIGGGLLKISNTSVSGTSEFIRLREDYGSTWDGTIEISNSSLTPNTDSPSLISMQASFDGNILHNFGYDIVIPNVVVNGFTINKSISSFPIYDNSKTGLLNGNLSIANNYTNGKFKFKIPTSIKYSNIKSTSGTPSVSKYKKSF